MPDVSLIADTEASRAIVEEVCASDTLPSVPVVAASVLSMSRSADCDFGELGEMISSDPAIVAKLLRMANSSVFAGVSKVGAVRDALVRMGIKVTRMTVLGFALEAEVGSKVPKSFNMDRFWRHALTTATAARTLAERIYPARRDEAFSAGILQDIGMVAFQCARADDYDAVFQARKNNRAAELYELELEVIGATHMQVGSKLLEKWGLPPEVYKPALYHHFPEQAEADGCDSAVIEVVRLLNLAIGMSALFNYKEKGPAHERVMSEARERFGLEEPEMEEMLGKIDVAVRETADLFSVDPRSINSYAEVRAQAAQEVARLAVEIGQEAQTAKTKAEERKQRLDALQSETDQLRQLAAHDELTGLLNRREFMKRFVNELVRCKRYKHDIGVLMFDIDHFKMVNDTFGHQVGDAVLRGMGGYLHKTARQSDVVGRYGGEEFIMLLPEADLQAVEVAADRIRAGIESESGAWAEELEGITVSVGGAQASHDCSHFGAKDIIALADKRLYKAKDGGRNCCCCAVLE